MAESIDELNFNEARRAITQQAQDLDELRSRTGALLAVAALSSSFLGDAVLGDDRASDCLVVVGGLCLAVVGSLSVAVLYPWSPRGKASDGLASKKGWLFTLSGDEIKAAASAPDAGVADLAKVYARLADTLDGFYDHNQRGLNRLYRAFELAAVLLVIGIALWLVALASA